MFELLNIARKGYVILVKNAFSYSAFSGFKGEEKFYVLVYDNGSPQKGAVFEIVVNVN